MPIFEILMLIALPANAVKSVLQFRSRFILKGIYYSTNSGGHKAQAFKLHTTACCHVITFIKIVD